MDIKLFTDLIDALGKVVGGLKALVSLPKSERESYRNVLDETNQLIHSTLNMIILRLGDILRIADEGRFLQEVYELENYTEWMETERKLRLCKSLRVAVSETEHMVTALTGKISVNDWGALLAQMHLILRSEGELANYIGEHFSDLALRARDAQPGSQNAKAIRIAAEATRGALKRERGKLLMQEVELLTYV